MTHRADTSSSARIGGFTGRVLAIAAATALCVAAIAVTVSMCGGPSTDPRPVVAPSGSVPSTEVAPSSTAPAAAPSSVATPSPAPSSIPSPAPRCTPQTKWVFRPSTGTYERITIPC